MLLETWPKNVSLKRAVPSSPGEPEVESQCFEMLKNPTYIGVGQRMVVSVPFERMVEVVDDYPAYVGIFEGLVRVAAVEVDGNRTVTEWEEEIPFPFVPNERNQMIHLVSTPRPGFKVYRYGLKKSNNQTKNDGVIVLEQSGKSKTLYTEYDFFDANWGIAKSFGLDHIWKDSLEDLFQSDLALKLKAENSSWLPARVKSESLAIAKSMVRRKDVCPKATFPFVSPEPVK